VRRREFTRLIGGAAIWPLAASAQQLKLPTIGLLYPTAVSSAPERTAAFVQRLRELGWTAGRNILIEYRWGEGRAERAAEFAAEFVRLKVDVIVTSGVPATVAAKRATAVIPIVFAVISNPVAVGVVDSLARPGGNVTGLSNQSADLAAKRIELLREAVSGLRRLTIIANVENPDPALETEGIEAAGRALGLEVATAKLRRLEDIRPAFTELQGRMHALYVVADPLVNTNFARIHTLATAARLPTMYNNRQHVEQGGLMSYGPNFIDLWRRTAEYVDKILRGVKPEDMPVEQPTKFDLIVNLCTAQAIGVTIPATLLARADEVIE
jgi:putative tryptophan/tyrosine transport system substrate-binding protein